MCGIVGIVGLSKVSVSAVQAMTDLLAHRGPDGEGSWSTSDGRVCFGHRRLAILDLSTAAAQPMHSGNGAVTITYNGEIYNYKEIRLELEELGVQFRTHSDTETILEAYCQWGEACVERFNGMFAFAIHDRQRQIIFCARDRLGEKPFLFVGKDNFFAFASEYKPLLLLENVSRKYDSAKLMGFFVDPTSALDQAETTLFDDIQELRPGHTLVLNTIDLSWRVKAYWCAPVVAEHTSMTLEMAASNFEELLQSSVQLRMRSDVPVGSCLSGGLDSSALSLLARRICDRANPYHVFTGRFPGTSADEGKWADVVVATADLTQHDVFPTAEGLLDDMQAFVWHNELPVDSASQYAQWCVFRAAKEQDVTVLLDGQGSDEILGGYEQYFAPYLASRRRDADFDPHEEAAIEARYPGAFGMRDNDWKRKIPLPVRCGLARLLGRGSSTVFGMTPDAAGAALRGGEAGASSAPSLLDALRKDTCNGFLSTLLRYGDRNSMAHSREVRLPFCDHRIVEFVWSLPVKMLMGNAQTKYLLRESMKNVLPDEIRTRWRKQGFQPPVATWFDGALYDVARELFESAAFRQSAYWDASWWQMSLRRYRAGERKLAAEIWKPLICEMWRKHFIERIRALPSYPALE